MRTSTKRAFTLIELILVIGILGLLLAITLVAINPARQFAQANNTKRRGDINALLNALTQYEAGNNGRLPSGITATAQVINKTTLDLCNFLVPTYIAALPVDPLTNSGTPVTDCSLPYNTNYSVYRSESDNRLTVSAPAAQNSETISISR